MITRQPKILIQKIFFLSLFLLFFFFYSHIATVHAAAPYQASDVLGQTDGSGNPVFNTNARDNGQPSVNATGYYNPESTAIDTIHHRLFVSDNYNYRVLVYNLDSNNNLIDHTADNVIGCADLTDASCSSNNYGYMYPGGMAYDAVHNRLFISDLYDYRVLVFDLTSGVTDGMDATYVLGQPDFNTYNYGALRNQFSSSYYGSLVYDSQHDRLFIDDEYSNYRIMVYDVAPASIHNGMDASYIIGGSDIDAQGDGTLDAHGISDGYGGLVYDEDRQLFFAADYSHNRIMIFDLSGGITNGMDASYVLGQSNFTTSDHGVTLNNLYGPFALSYDHQRHRLFVSDYHNQRILMFDITNLSTNMDASAVLVASDFTSVGSTDPTQFSVYQDYEDTIAFDSTNNRLYYPDYNNQRVMIFDFIKLTDASLPNGTVGSSYSSTLASQFQGTLNWQVTSGSIPPGLSLTSDGKLSGNPTASGTYAFSLKATDDNGAIGSFSDSHSYSVMIAAAPQTPTTPSSQNDSSVVNNTTQADGASDIILNHFSDFFTDQGITIKDLKVGDLLHFCLDGTSNCDPATNSTAHTVTVTNIDTTNNTVTVTFHSDPVSVTLALNTPKTVDLNGDGVADIVANLTGLTATTADINFRSIEKVGVSNSGSTTTNQNQPNQKHSLVWLWITLGVVLVGILGFVIMKKRSNSAR